MIKLIQGPEQSGLCSCCVKSAGLDRRQLFMGAATAMLAATPVCAAAAVSGSLIEPQLVLPLDRGIAKPVALTLDACSGGFDGQILNALIAWNIPATMFVTGLWLARHPQAVAAILAHPDLFSFANHGARHQAMVLGDRTVYGQKAVATVEAAKQEVMDGARLITEATGTKPRWFRGATALYSASLLPMIETWGFRVAGYSLNGDGGASLPAATVATRIGQARAGDVIIAHINQPHRSSGTGVVAGVKHLVDQGFTFTTLEGAVSVKNY